MKSMCQEVRRNSPSVTSQAGLALQLDHLADRIVLDGAQARASSTRRNLTGARLGRRGGRRRLPTWSARNGGVVRTETLACDAV